MDARLKAFRVSDPASFAKQWAKQDGYEKGDELAPFFSEAFLYNLLGKEDARTLLALGKRKAPAA